MKKTLLLLIIIITSLALASCTSQEITGAAIGIQQAQDRTITSNPVNIQINPIDDGPPPGAHTVNSISQLKNVNPSSHTEVWVTGYYSTGDWGSPRFYEWSPTNTQEDNGGTIIQSNTGSTGRWIMHVPENYYNVRWFGASPARDDNQIYFQRTINEARDSGVMRVYLPRGVYYVSGTAIHLRESHNGMEVFGDPIVSVTDSAGRPMVNEEQSTVIRRAPVSGTITLVRIGKDPDPVLENIILRNIAINGNHGNNPHGSGGHGLLLYGSSGGDSNHRPVNNILIENLWIYNNWGGPDGGGPDSCTPGNGVQNYFENVHFRNVVVHDNWAHGVGNARSGNFNVYENIIAYRNGVDRGCYGIDISTGEGITLTNFEIFENGRGMKIPSVRDFRAENGLVRDNVRQGFTTSGGGSPANIFIDNVTARGNADTGLRFGDGAVGVYLGRLVSEDNDKRSAGSNNFAFLSSEDVHVEHLISRNYFGAGEASIFLGYGNPGIFRSAWIYDNDAAGIEFYNSVDITLANAKFENNNHQFDIRRRNTGTFIVRHSRLDDGNGGMPRIQSGIILVALPSTEMVSHSGQSTVARGTTIELRAIAAANEEGRSVSSVRFFRLEEGESIHSKVEIGVASLVTGTWRLNWDTANTPRGNYFIFAEATDSAGDRSIERRSPETGVIVEPMIGIV